MRIDRQPPGEELNRGEETVPRPAASVVVLRESAEGPEVLLVKRNPEQRFMGGAWVFPGGSVHADDGGPSGAGIRELEEEASIVLDAEAELVPLVRWITPVEVKTRFDTWFYVTEAPAGQEGVCDGGECVDLRWMRPADALSAHERDEMMLVFPTIRTLQRLAAFGSVEVALDAARAADSESILPRVVMRDDHAEVLLPGEPGYDSE